MGALSAVYGQVARLRRSWYEQRPHSRRTLARPVISIGNLSVGGSGKTPVTAAIARLLLLAGERPSILSRGYGRRTPADGVVVASDVTGVRAPVEATGDEPQMLARSLPGVPVLVCADRYLAGSLAERQFGCTVHLLDDGFQHLQLARTVDLLLVSRRDLDDSPLPSGRLREPLAAAGRADALLVTGAREDAEEAAAAFGVSSTFLVEPRFGGGRWFRGDPPGEPGLTGGRVVAVAGIAHPGRFFETLRALGWDVAREMPFPDHHWFSDADHARIAAAVRDTKADGVITTEKDAVRLSPAASETRWAVLPMQVAIEPAGDFAEWLLARVRHGGSRRSPKGEGG